MATDDELIKDYGRVSAELKHHEDGVEKAKEARKEIAKQLFERHGKGHVYDLGDGVAMIIVASKAQTYFFTPKEKWKKGGRKKKAKPEVIEASATLTAKGGVQNVPVPKGAVLKSEPPPSVPPEQTLVVERLAGGELTVKLEQQAPEEAPTKAAPEPTGDADIDALAAALAELE